jgi:hypothetical protein
MTSDSTITVLSPSYDRRATVTRALPVRPARLQSATVGMLSNGKVGTRIYFDHLERLVREQWDVAQVVRRTKRNYSAPAEPALIREAVDWEVMFAGVGD